MSLASAVALATGGLGYAAGYEVRAFRLRRVDIPVLPPGTRPLQVLHLSDLHLTPGQRRKQDWVRGLAALEPDLVVTTGDNIGHPAALAPLLAAYGALLERPGAFVLGSNDYYAPVAKNPARYLRRDARRGTWHGPDLPYEEMSRAFRESGWVDLDNARALVEAGGLRLAMAGVDDPHLHRDDHAAVAGPPEPADVAVALTHAPYLRVLDAFVADGYPLILAGHTHGGQLCVPGWGALVTNCDLDTRRAKGLSRHRVGDREAWLHVSAGLGTSPYAPVRFACPPEATLLTLVPRG